MRRRNTIVGFFLLTVISFMFWQTTEHRSVSYFSPENGLILQESYWTFNFLPRYTRLITTSSEYRETGYSWFLIGYPHLEDLEVEFRPRFHGEPDFPLDPVAHHLVFSFLIQKENRKELKDEIVSYMHDRQSERSKRFREDLITEFNDWMEELDVVSKHQDLYRRWSISPDHNLPSKARRAGDLSLGSQK